jgi:hypothetical protein
MALADVSAPNVQNPASGASGGALDTQGRFTFGGITTTGVGGTSTNAQSDTASYAAMAVIAVVIFAIGFVIIKHK